MTGTFYKSLNGKSYLVVLADNGELVKIKANSFEELMILVCDHLKVSRGWAPIGQIKIENEVEFD